MSNFDELIQKARNIQRSMIKVQERKKEWEEEKISEVENYINEVIEHINEKEFDFEFEINRTKNNYGFSVLHLNMKYNDDLINIFNKPNYKQKIMYLISGGTLSYAPQYNGEISIFYYEPQIYKHNDRRTNRNYDKRIERIKLEEISQGMIQKHLGEFFKLLNQWELGE